jgi:hypothetical protein
MECWRVGDKVLYILHGCYLFCSKVEDNVFASQVNTGTSMLSEVFYEYSYEPAGAKKAADAGDIYQYQPILNFLHLGFMGDMAFTIALLPQDNDGWDAEFEFLPRECTADIFELL